MDEILSKLRCKNGRLVKCMDMEKIKKELEEICEYTMRPHESRVLNDVLALLKEQEPVKPNGTKSDVIRI